MPLPYTGSHGELNFESDFVEELRHAGWQEVLKNKTVPELIDNWRNIIFKRNRDTLNDIPLSESEKRSFSLLMKHTVLSSVRCMTG